MKSINVLTDRKYKFNININLTVIGIFLFVFYFTTNKTFLLPSLLGLIILMLSVVILLISILLINNKGILITRVDTLWVIFLILFVSHIAFNNLITQETIVDIFVYTSCIIFLLLIKVKISYFDYPLKLIKILGLIYACSAIFQYLYTDVYISYILPLFNQYEQFTILKLLNKNSYTGFTNQTAHLAGYTVSGIGIILFSNWKRKFSTKILPIFFLILLIIGLLLSAKRAHLIFMIIAVIITTIVSINSKRFINNIVKLTASGVFVLLLLYVLYNSIDNNNDSPISIFFNELKYTINGLIEGEDVSSGRITLYKHSWELFNDNVLFGIGWREFRKNSLGLISTEVGSHPHNIYLQLLSEMGIIIFLFFIIPVLYLYFKTYRLLRFLSVDNTSQKWKNGIQFSFYTQTFFLLYGLTGNLLTDFNFLMIYFFACSISLSAMVFLKSDYSKFL